MSKTWTSLDQARKLTEILPLESADMCYINGKAQLGFLYEEYKELGDSILQEYEPCWSLSSLLDILKDNIKIEKTQLDQSDMFTYSIIGDGYDYKTYEHEELIDACYEMIIELHKKNKLVL